MKMNYRETDGEPILREECHYCFEQSLSQGGLYCCLYCDFSCCSTHTNLHNQKTGHGEFVLIQYQLKPEIQIEQLREKMKSNDLDDLVDVNNVLFKLSNSKLEEITEPTDEQMVAAALITDCPKCSKYRYLKQVTTSQNINQKQKCDHLPDASQSQQPLQQFKCKNCDLDKNLWLCLTCGQLCCGRKSWDGTGGNSHALQHYEETKHPCVLKITSCCESLQEVYCYKCDDELKIDNSNTQQLQQILEQYGLLFIMKRAVGSEVSLEEMVQNKQLIINQEKQDTKKEISLEEYNQLNMIPLQNTGNTCYANCIFNSLISLNVINAQHITNHFEVCSHDSYTCQLCQLARLIQSINLKYNQNYFRISPRPHLSGLLLSMNSYLTSSENIGRQQDAQEFLNIFMNKINNKQLMLPETRKEIECSKCGYLKLSISQPQQYISLTCNFFDQQINQQQPVQIQLAESLQKDMFGLQQNVYDYKCPKCGVQNVRNEEQVIRIGQSFVSKLPKTVTVIANRLFFDQLNQKVCKLKTQIANNKQIDFNILNGKKYNNAIKSDSKSQQNNNDDAKNIQQIVDFGFSKEQAMAALHQGNYDVQRATELIFDNMVKFDHLSEQNAANAFLSRIKGTNEQDTDLTKKLMEMGHDGNESPQLYQLEAFVCHLGQSYDCGHYVCYCSTALGWIECNDDQFNKVEEDQIEQLAQNAYILFYQKSDL